MKITLFKKENSFKKKDFTFNQIFYWKLAVTLIFFSIIFSFFFGYCFFRRINQETVLPLTNAGQQLPIVNKNRIEKVLNYFSEREKKSNEILNFPSPVVDPSL